LGTPPINVFSGRVEGGKLYIGEEAVLDANGIDDRAVTVAIRPEGFVLDDNGALSCQLSNVEVMGRDVSVVSTHPAMVSPAVRSIIDADYKVDRDVGTMKFTLKPHKVFLFDRETEERIYFGDQQPLSCEFLENADEAYESEEVSEPVAEEN
jgi:multiple sugar transport system ATP-binding protein